MWLSRTMGADVCGSMAVLDKSWWGELRRWQASGGHGGWQQGVAGEDSHGGPGRRNKTGSCSKGRGMARRQQGVARRLCLWLQLGVGHAGVTRQPGRVVVQPEFPALRGGSDAIPVFFKMKLGQLNQQPSATSRPLLKRLRFCYFGLRNSLLLLCRFSLRLLRSPMSGLGEQAQSSNRHRPRIARWW